MRIIYRVDGLDFETLDDALAHVVATHFADAANVGCEREADQDGYHLEVFDEDSDAEPGIIYIVESV